VQAQQRTGSGPTRVLVQRLRHTWQAAAQAVSRARQPHGRQAPQSTALMDFMLGDLQRQLSHLGRPDLLRSVGERALAHLADDNLQGLDTPALAQRARALRMIGESAQQRMDQPQARAAFEQAASTTGRLLALAPDDIQRIQDHAASLKRMAYLVDTTLDSDAFIALGQQISALLWRAAACAPLDPVLQLQACSGDHWPAAGLLHGDRATESLALLARTQARLQRLPPDLEGLPRVQAIQLALTGQACHHAGRDAEATVHLQAFLALQPAQHAAVRDITERAENLAAMHILAQAWLNLGQLAPATALARQAAANAESDAEQMPDNLLVTERLIRHRTQLATCLWLCGDGPAARAQLAWLDAALARVGKAPADNKEWHVHRVGAVLALHARMASQPPETPVPDPAWLAALQTHADHVAALDAQGCRLPQGELLVVLAVGLAHGDALLAQGDSTAARLRWQAVVERALPAATAGGHVAMQHVALALLRLGQAAQARPWVERLQASPWRHPDLAALQHALAAAPGGAAARAA
jgi:hypothetical protein